MPLPLAGREDHREDHHPRLAAAVEKADDLDVGAVVGVEKALADKDQGNICLRNLGADLVVPLVADDDALVGPELGALSLQAAQKAQERALGKVFAVRMTIADKNPDRPVAHNNHSEIRLSVCIGG
ncbi:MAG TPA: hypothetical protein VLX28_13870 [Thermoanaerobaculia bacterium]|nr:hypothetical protein [Thermoanaerobaculia bacterium]